MKYAEASAQKAGRSAHFAKGSAQSAKGSAHFAKGSAQNAKGSAHVAKGSAQSAKGSAHFAKGFAQKSAIHANKVIHIKQFVMLLLQNHQKGASIFNTYHKSISLET